MNDNKSTSINKNLLSEDQVLQNLRFIVETHRREFELRRGYQWRGIIAGLTFCALIIAARIHKDTAQIIQDLDRRLLRYLSDLCGW